MRRKPGALLPIEISLLRAGVELRLQNKKEFHGFAIAKAVKSGDDAKRFVTQGTLYRALNRMAKTGLLTSKWEDPEIAEREGRPRRRLYQLTLAGEQALAKSEQVTATSKPTVADAQTSRLMT